jgi:hypothetical protein
MPFFRCSRPHHLRSDGFPGSTSDAWGTAYDVVFGLCEDFVLHRISVVLDIGLGWQFQWQRLAPFAVAIQRPIGGPSCCSVREQSLGAHRTSPRQGSSNIRACRLVSERAGLPDQQVQLGSIPAGATQRFAVQLVSGQDRVHIRYVYRSGIYEERADACIAGDDVRQPAVWRLVLPTGPRCR